MPGNVVLTRVKKNVSQSLAKTTPQKVREYWNKTFEMEHADAIIHDSFWYVICRVFNPEQYIETEELLLDRIAANYVSYTVVVEAEDNKKEREKKDKFFKFFYDTVAQSVFFSLFYAFPKSRSRLNEELQRELLNIFSHLFTGVEIQSAKTDHWKLDTGAGNMIKKSDNSKSNMGNKLTLADVGILNKKKEQKAKRTPIQMQYSPLVQRYLEKHQYETMNSVRQWRMMLTQKTQAQKETDLKFIKYQKIAKQAMETKNRVVEELKQYNEEMRQKIIQNEIFAQEHIKLIKKLQQERIESGNYSEYSNMLVSIKNSEHVKMN